MKSKAFLFMILAASLTVSSYAEDHPAMRDVPFVYIPPGSFMMGSEDNQQLNEFYQRIEIKDGFEIMSTELSQLTYYQITNRNPSRFKSEKDCPDEHLVKEVSGEKYSTKVGICPNLPVEQLLIAQAAEVARIATENSTRYIYQLPSEAEWEYAARAGTDTEYFFGTDWNTPYDGEPILNTYAVNYHNQCGQAHSPRTICYDRIYPLTANIGTHRDFANQPNPWGIYDMYGNVAEFTRDEYQKRYTGEEYSCPKSYALRGGSAMSSPWLLRSATRSEVQSTYFSNTTGFRLIRRAK